MDRPALIGYMANRLFPAFVYGLILYGISFLIYPAVFDLQPGIFYFSDTQRYFDAAQILISSRFDYGAMFEAFRERYAALPFASVHVTVVAATILVAGENYGLLVFGLGLAVLGLGTALLATRLSRLTENPWAGLLLPLLLFSSANVAYHSKAVLTESMFSGLVMITLWLALEYIEHGGWRKLSLLAIVTVIAGFYRASGPAVLGVLIVVLAIRLLPHRLARGRGFVVSLCALVAAGLVAVTLFGVAAVHTHLLPFRPDGMIMLVTEDLSEYLSQDSFRLADPESTGQFLVVFLARLQVYFGVLVEHYSTLHNVHRSVLYGIAYLGLLAGCAVIVVSKDAHIAGKTYLAGLMYFLSIPFFHASVHMLAPKSRLFMYGEGVLIFLGIYGYVLLVQELKRQKAARIRPDAV